MPWERIGWEGPGEEGSPRSLQSSLTPVSRLCPGWQNVVRKVWGAGSTSLRAHCVNN